MLNAESLQIILHKYTTVKNRLRTLVLDYSCDQSESPKVNQIRAPIFLSRCLLASHVPKVATLQLAQASSPLTMYFGIISTQRQTICQKTSLHTERNVVVAFFKIRRYFQESWDSRLPARSLRIL